MPFIIQHFVFGTAGTAAFLAADFFGELLCGGLLSQDLLLNLFYEEAPREKTVHRLRAVFLTLNGNSCGAMHQLNAGGGFVDVLTAFAAGAHETLIEIVLKDPQGLHAIA